MSTVINIKNVTKSGLGAIGASVSNQAISEEFGLSADGSLHVRVDIETTAAAGTVTAKLQMRSPGGAYADLAGANASVTISGAGTFSLTQAVERSVDQPNMPLQKMMRAVVTTAGASSVTISRVYLQQAH